MSKKLKDFPRYEENPTASKHKIIGLDILPASEAQKRIVLDGGVIMEEYMEKGYTIKVYDTLQFVKLFPDAQKDLIKLSSSGIALFTFILINLKQMQEQIILLPEHFAEWYNGLPDYEETNARMVFYRGVINLLENKFVFLKVGEGSYFINVNKFFNGDRRKIDWVGEIAHKLKEGGHVARKEVAYLKDYKSGKKND
jgi:hypothetical protein